MRIATTAERLKQVMQENDLKQVDVLKRCDSYCQKFNVKLQKNDLSQYLSGKVVPSQKKLTVLALGLNVTEPWLMGFDVDRNEMSMILTIHERKVILAYRYHSEMQDAVDRLLEVESEKKFQIPG